MRTVAIFGVGLIGGSFALALKKAGFAGEILGVSSERSIGEALRRGAIDRGVPFEEAACEADLLYLATPIHRIIEDIQRMKEFLKPGALVTDAGSTKQEIADAAATHLAQDSFLGGHPMAGKESRGVNVADADLFKSRTYVLTPTSAQQLEGAGAKWLVEWIRKIGANPLILTPGEHDHAVAFTSHLPQLASTALTIAAAGNLTDASSQKTTGQGFQDMTRLAHSSFDMWKDILETNTVEIDRALETYIKVLMEMREGLKDPASMQPLFESAAEFRKRLYSATILR